MPKALTRLRLLWLLSFLLTATFFSLAVARMAKLQSSYDPDESQLTDDHSLALYLKDFFSKENPREMPILLPTGVFISSLTWINAQSFYISGLVWQKYPLDYPKEASKGFILAEATDFKKTESYHIIKDDYEVIGWSFEGKINQRFDYARYPIDNKIIHVRLWHQDFTQKILLTPDFASYQSTKAADKFGLDPEIVLSSYNILESFFRYRYFDYDTNFGLSNKSKQTKFPELYYNIVLKREASDAVIEHILPLIVVIILCFSSLLSNTVNPKKREIYNFSYMEILTQCGALFFVVLLAHIHLRQSLPGAGIIYLEYLYVLAYICVIYVTFNAFLVVHAELSNKIAYKIAKYEDNLISKIIFLPIFSALTLLIICYCY
jgi:uncharacterized membrane protein